MPMLVTNLHNKGPRIMNSLNDSRSHWNLLNSQFGIKHCVFDYLIKLLINERKLGFYHNYMKEKYGKIFATNPTSPFFAGYFI